MHTCKHRQLVLLSQTDLILKKKRSGEVCKDLLQGGCYANTGLVLACHYENGGLGLKH